MAERTEAEKREVYDLEAVYDQQIAPLMTRIIEICKKHRMPLFASFAYAYDDGEDGTGFCTTYLHSDGRRPEALVRANHAVRSSPGFAAFTITTREPASGG